MIPYVPYCITLTIPYDTIAVTFHLNDWMLSNVNYRYFSLEWLNVEYYSEFNIEMLITIFFFRCNEF